MFSAWLVVFETGSGPLGFGIIADTAPPVTPPPVLPMPSLVASVVPAAKMRSRAALYRTERSASVSAPIGVEAGELELSLASPFFCVERFRMRMGDWKAEAGGTTLGVMDPVLGDVTTS